MCCCLTLQACSSLTSLSSSPFSSVAARHGPCLLTESQAFVWVCWDGMGFGVAEERYTAVEKLTDCPASLGGSLSLRVCTMKSPFLSSCLCVSEQSIHICLCLFGYKGYCVEKKKTLTRIYYSCCLCHVYLIPLPLVNDFTVASLTPKDTRKMIREKGT